MLRSGAGFAFSHDLLKPIVVKSVWLDVVFGSATAYGNQSH
jgi:hypothetical protein